MNPKFAKSVADRNGIRNEYLKNLQLETSNNLMNYNANQIFKQTGQLPPSITALVDTRSITEKYADKQKARVAVLSGLREITDGANANQIIDQIQGNDMVDLLNNLPQIISEIKPKWSLGITAPAFMAYWNRYKQALSLNAGVSTLAVLQSNQLLTNIQGLLQNIQATLATKQDYTLLKSVFSLLPQTEEVQRATQMIQEAENDTQTVYSLATEMSIRGTKDPLTFEQQIQDLNSAVENLPPRSAIVGLTQQAQIISQLGNSPQEANELASQARGQLALTQPKSYEEVVEELEQIQRETTPTPKKKASQSSQSSQESEEGEDVGGSPESDISDLTESTYQGIPTKDLPPVYKLTKSMEDFNKIRFFNEKKRLISVVIGKSYILKKNIDWGQARNFSGLNRSNYDTTNLPELLNKFFERAEKEREERRLKKLGGQQESKKGIEPLPPTARQLAEGILLDPLEPTAKQIAEGGKETGTGIKRKHRIQGRGVNANRTHAETTTLTSGGNYRRIPKVDTSHKVEKVPSYIQFGKHLLHQHNLLGGILQIRRHSGNIINELPRQAIGGKLRNVLIKLTGTGSPSFEDINELSTHEKELLNKVVKNCKIDQRLLVPTPNKTKEEQDMNRLQILSGEITAGNNNPTIVKELKTLLLRLKNSGRIPKREAHEIMEDLLTLGY
jgi:hypothetical protein